MKTAIALFIYCLAAHLTQGAQPIGDPVFAPYRELAEVAIENELAALADEQSEGGSFAGHYGRETGTVALVGMAFLAKGYLPGQGRYGRTVDRCIDYVIKEGNENGLLADPKGGNSTMYSHGISTLFLSEVSGMVDASRQIRIEKTLPKAVRLLLDAQAVRKETQHQGGWRYRPTSRDSDLSVVGWAVMALRSAKTNGAPVPESSVKAAVNYVKNCYSKNGSFSYMATQGGHSSGRSRLNGVGVLCLELLGMHGSEILYKVGDSIIAHPHIGIAYSAYYEAQAMFQLGGKYWKEYADQLYPAYLGPSREQRGNVGLGKGAVYERALKLLALSVPYRQLPIYQRDETVHGN